MSKEEQFYLGDWIDNNPPKDHDNIIKCISVDANKKIAIFDDGQRISFVNLDLGEGRYEKVLPITQCDEVMNNLGGVAASLGCKAPQSAVLGDLSKIGNHEQPRVSEELRESSHEPKPSQETHKPYIPDDPTGMFISSAIQISRKAGKKSVVPLVLNLELDFDILYVIQAAMGLGASDVEILQHILGNIDIRPEHIKRLIAEELLKSPEDAEIASSNREQEFHEALTEELNKDRNGVSDEPKSETQSIERYEEKED